MAYPPGYQFNTIAWPVGYVTASKSQIPTTDKSYLAFQPSLGYKQSIANAVAVATNSHATTFAGPNTTTASATLNGARAGINDFPRNIVITVTHASAVVALSGTITGKDKYGKTITEAWSVTAGTTSKTFTGAVAFKSISAVTVTAASDASANSVVIGHGKVFGLDFKTNIPSLIKEMDDASVVTTGTVVAGSAAANTDYRGTYLPAGTPDGTKDWLIWYVVDDPTDIGT